MFNSVNRLCSVLVTAIVILGMHASLAPLTAYAENPVTTAHVFMMTDSKEKVSC